MYKFIGTEQDLIDNGFKFIECAYFRGFTETLVMVDVYDGYVDVNLTNAIQDLIDKGLVVEV